MGFRRGDGGRTKSGTIARPQTTARRHATPHVGGTAVQTMLYTVHEPEVWPVPN